MHTHSAARQHSLRWLQQCDPKNFVGGSLCKLHAALGVLMGIWHRHAAAAMAMSAGPTLDDAWWGWFARHIELLSRRDAVRRDRKSVV